MSPRRSWTGVAASALFHAVALAAVLSAAPGVGTRTSPRVARPLMFISVAAVPDPAIVVRSAPLRVAPATLRARAPIERLKITPPADVLPPAEPDKPRPAPEAIVARAEPVRSIEPPRRNSTPPGHAFEPPSTNPVQFAGFDAPAARAAPVDLKRTAVGGFDAPPAAGRPQPGSDRPIVVSEAGFGTTLAVPGVHSGAHQVTDAGFAAAQPQAPARGSSAAVKTTDFDSAPPSAAPQAAPRPTRIEVPLEILTKPTPAYTDEARALKIEGDVVLEVEFTAAGEVRVLRVVRGLGHGLDEAATRAALGIRFKPAQSGGRATDFRTTIHIVFRLA